MNGLTLVAAAFGLAFALPALWLLTALARKLPFWVPGLVVLAAAVLLAVSNTRPESCHGAPCLAAWDALGFELQNGLAIGVAVAGALGLATGVRRWLRAHDPTNIEPAPAVELPTAVVKHDALKI